MTKSRNQREGYYAGKNAFGAHHRTGLATKTNGYFMRTPPLNRRSFLVNPPPMRREWNGVRWVLFR